MGVSISHSVCPQGPEGDSMRQTAYLVLFGLSSVLCVPEASPSPSAIADPDAHRGAWGYGGLGSYGYGGLGTYGHNGLGAYGYGGLNGGLYRGYGGYGWGRKKRNADAVPSADPTPDPAADADAHWNAWGYGLNRWGGLYGGYGLNGGLYGYASPYWRGYGGYWGRR